MHESANLFENFIQRFYLKYGKLQIDGFHGVQRVTQSVSPRKRMAGLMGNINNGKPRSIGIGLNRSKDSSRINSSFTVKEGGSLL